MELSAISETAIITLRARLAGAGKEHPIIQDPTGRFLLDQLLAVLPDEVRGRLLRKKVPASLVNYLSLRARYFDRCAKEFLAHPEARVVSLGAGFDTRYWRIGARPGQYLELDLPALIDLKRDILKEKAEYEMMACSVRDKKWIAELAGSQNSRVLFLAEGLFMYLEEADVKDIFRDLASSFTRSQIVFENVHRKYTKGLMGRAAGTKMARRAGSKTDVKFSFGLAGADEIRLFDEKLRVLEEWSHFNEPELHPAFQRLFRGWKAVTRTQWVIRAEW